MPALLPPSDSPQAGENLPFAPIVFQSRGTYTLKSADAPPQRPGNDCGLLSDLDSVEALAMAAGVRLIRKIAVNWVCEASIVSGLRTPQKCRRCRVAIRMSWWRSTDRLTIPSATWPFLGNVAADQPG